MTSRLHLNGTFGFDLEEGQHHFLILIPQGRSKQQMVSIYECPRFMENKETAVPRDALERVQIPMDIWKAISDQVRAVFNLRLKEAKRKTGSWSPGPNYLAPHYGKELVLLGWALESSPLEKADIVFRNWRGLAPEERWWLYSTANAPFSQNSKKGEGVGWRKALGIALSENPLIDDHAETAIPKIAISKEARAISGAKEGVLTTEKMDKGMSKKSTPRKKNSKVSDSAASSADPQGSLFDS